MSFINYCSSNLNIPFASDSIKNLPKIYGKQFLTSKKFYKHVMCGSLLSNHHKKTSIPNVDQEKNDRDHWNIYVHDQRMKEFPHLLQNGKDAICWYCWKEHRKVHEGFDYGHILNANCCSYVMCSVFYFSHKSKRFNPLHTSIWSYITRICFGCLIIICYCYHAVCLIILIPQDIVVLDQITDLLIDAKWVATF